MVVPQRSCARALMDQGRPALCVRSPGHPRLRLECGETDEEHRNQERRRWKHQFRLLVRRGETGERGRGRYREDLRCHVPCVELGLAIAGSMGRTIHTYLPADRGLDHTRIRKSFNVQCTQTRLIQMRLGLFEQRIGLEGFCARNSAEGCRVIVCWARGRVRGR